MWRQRGQELRRDRRWFHRGGRALVLVVSPLLVGTIGHSQTAPADVAFEVVSIKRNASVVSSRARLEPGRFTAVGVPIVQIIRQAYDVIDMQLGPIPDWARSDGYDIVAKSPDGVDLGPNLRRLLQSMLKSRFHFASHVERREMPVYELTVERSDRKLGPALRASAADCSVDPPVLPPASERDPDAPPCALSGTIGRRTMRGFPLSRFAQMLTPEAGRVVYDKTSLAGTWNIELEYMPTQGIPPLPPGGLPFGASLPSPDAPNLFTAVQEQLGLKLVSSRASVDVLIVDRLERPTED